jgi:hypothetical protein
MSQPHSMILLKLLLERGPLSATQLAEASGLSRKQVTDAVHSLRVRQAMETGERPYLITDVGRGLAWNREARTKRIAEKAARPKRAMGRPKKKAVSKIPDMPVVRRIVAAPAAADSIVSTAVQSRPALQDAWGAMHA